jgi:cytochrome c556
MGISAKFGVVAVAAVVAGVALLSSETISAAMMGMEAVKARQDAMKSMGKDMKVIQGFVKDGKGTAADVGVKAAAIAATAKGLPALFPKGSGRPDMSDKDTRAEPKIWKDWAGFEKHAKFVVAEAGKLAEVANGGDTKAIAAQFGKLGKEGCGGCHKNFRGEKVK